MDNRILKEAGAISEFFKGATFQISFNDKKAEVYQELVFYRFKESLESTFPLTFKYLLNNKEAKQISPLIKEFISRGVISLNIRDMAGEFQDFLPKRLNEFKWLRDLMWFEYSEVRVMSGRINAKGRKANLENIRDFYNDCFILSECSLLGKVSHDVFNASIRERDETGIIVYRKSNESTVRYKTVSIFTFNVLANFQKNMNLKDSLDQVLDLFNFNTEDRGNAEEIFQTVLEDLYNSEIVFLK